MWHNCFQQRSVASDPSKAKVRLELLLAPQQGHTGPVSGPVSGRGAASRHHGPGLLCLVSVCVCGSSQPLAAWLCRRRDPLSGCVTVTSPPRKLAPFPGLDPGGGEPRGGPDPLLRPCWLTLSTGEQVQVGREEGGRPPEGEAALGGGAGGRVPEDPRRLGPAGPHQPGAAQEGAVSRPWAQVRPAWPCPPVLPLTLTLTLPDVSQSLQRWAWTDWAGRVAGQGSLYSPLLSSDEASESILTQFSKQNL